MKKLKMKILSLILVISLLLSVFVIYASADENTLEYSSVAHHYFESLGSHIPPNVHGSCVYVAMSMLLSFYDMYWSDCFVEKNYEYNGYTSAFSWEDFPNGTPWINIERIEEGSDIETDETAYRSFVQTASSNNLHPYLISIGISENVGHEVDNDTGFGIDIDETIEVLNKYLNLIFGTANYYAEDGNYNPDLPVTIHAVAEYWPGQSRDSVLSAVRNQVIQGNPVIFGGHTNSASKEKGDSSTTTGSNNSKAGHAMIAYHVTEDADILLNTGHTGNRFDSVENTIYQTDIDAVWLEINENILPHKCSNKYLFMTNSNSFYTCSCNAYKTLHPKHKHSYSIQLIDANTHKYQCNYGCDAIIEHHALKHVSLDNSYHNDICNCGYITASPHIFVNTANPRYMRCTMCSYTKDNWGPGQNVQMGYDESEETE